MFNTLISELFVLSTFVFTFLLAYYDKIEEDLKNYSKRNLLGYGILFSLLGLFFKLNLY